MFACAVLPVQGLSVIDDTRRTDLILGGGTVMLRSNRRADVVFVRATKDRLVIIGFTVRWQA